MRERRAFVRNSGWRLFTEGLVAISSLVQVVVMGWALGLNGTGQVLLAMAGAQILKSLLGLGMPLSVVWQLPRRQDQQGSVSGAAFPLALGALGVMALLYIPARLIVDGPEFDALWTLISIVTALQIAGDHLSGSLRALGQLGAANLARLSQSLSGLLGVSIAAILIPTPAALFAGWVCGWLVHAVWTAVAVRRANALGWTSSASIFAEQAIYGLRVYPGLLLTHASHRVDLLLVGALLDSAAAGVYGVAVRVVEGLNLIPMAVTFVSFPAASRGASERRPSELRSVLVVALAGAAPAALFVGIAAPIAIPWVFGAEFREAVAPLTILLPGVVAMATTKVVFSELVARGRTTAYLWLSGSGLVALLCLDLLLIPPYGVIGAAIASTVAYVIGASLALFASRDLHRARAQRPSDSNR